jgi:hypothetical protein
MRPRSERECEYRCGSTWDGTGSDGMACAGASQSHTREVQVCTAIVVGDAELVVTDVLHHTPTYHV